VLDRYPGGFGSGVGDFCRWPGWTRRPSDRLIKAVGFERHVDLMFDLRCSRGSA
jgi:hypothetical protein